VSPGLSVISPAKGEMTNEICERMKQGGRQAALLLMGRLDPGILDASPIRDGMADPRRDTLESCIASSKPGLGTMAEAAFLNDS